MQTDRRQVDVVEEGTGTYDSTASVTSELTYLPTAYLLGHRERRDRATACLRSLCDAGWRCGGVGGRHVVCCCCVLA